MAYPRIIDVGGGTYVDNLRSRVRERFFPPPGKERTLPMELFYQTEGLQLWNELVDCPEYTQFDNEQIILENNADVLCKYIRPGSALFDMGSSDSRKVRPLLDRIEALKIEVDYYAVDLSREELEKALPGLQADYHHIRCTGLWGTFIDVRSWFTQLDKPALIMCFGSMFGNDEFQLAYTELRLWGQHMRQGDLMLIGVDCEEEYEGLWNSYHDKEELWHRYVRCGLELSNQVLQTTWYREEEWFLSGKIRRDPTMHIFTIEALKDISCPDLGLSFARGDKIEFFDTWKYPPTIMHRQFKLADLCELERFGSSELHFYQYLLSAKNMIDTS